MSVWYCIPSARKADSTVPFWRKAGYKTALWIDPSPELATGISRVCGDSGLAELVICGEYPGYAKAVNQLVKTVLAEDHGCDWVVTGGDDILPDPNHSPDEIARECEAYFGQDPTKARHPFPYSTFGVMQATGDRWGDDAMGRAQWPHAPAYIDRVAGSPWIGREYALRVNGGQGPIWPEYWHMFEDEELQEVATKLGVFWQRRDLIQFHRHWGRDGDPAACPEFLKQSSGPEHWKEALELFMSRKAAGFPGHEPL